MVPIEESIPVSIACYPLVPGAYLVRVIGELGLATSSRLDQAFDLLLEDSRLNRLDFDLSGVSVIDSAGLGSLLRVLRRLYRRGGTARLVASTASVTRAFALTGLSHFFKGQP